MGRAERVQRTKQRGLKTTPRRVPRFRGAEDAGHVAAVVRAQREELKQTRMEERHRLDVSRNGSRVRGAVIWDFKTAHVGGLSHGENGRSDGPPIRGRVLPRESGGISSRPCIRWRCRALCLRRRYVRRASSCVPLQRSGAGHVELDPGVGEIAGASAVDEGHAEGEYLVGVLGVAEEQLELVVVERGDLRVRWVRAREKPLVHVLRPRGHRQENLGIQLEDTGHASDGRCELSTLTPTGLVLRTARETQVRHRGKQPVMRIQELVAVES